MGKRQTAIGTLVERQTRYVMLFPLPDGNTGQRQRVAIARSPYRTPSVLIFDEGTSALDNITEAELIGTLDSIRSERTIIIVVHRLTTVRKCDRIVCW